ncbi:Adenine/guanine permease AZG1 [Seminavis robusta]|uniref:Adenine/guanine permease AZG1 n=1 Tax=Seminavis robusta TaxID=568900 RepID=A0A9N8D9K4_9STRA|nr:Adenine/guanine permease AZG1 [Seminavis robusta]|eukprot:Sro9_g007200.1 Adenine/guanine permease AZG1 (567) ;mRNA; r:77059-78845
MASGMIEKLNAAVHHSPVGRFFDFEGRKTNFTSEFRGAAATFMSMAYILAVNPRILADSGGPCVPNEDDGGIFGDTYLECQEAIKREFVTSTAIASLFGCLCMGLLANLPIALAPGMGMNAYFTYSVVGWRGTGKIGYEAAVTAVLIEGVIFSFLALTGVRHAITKLIPEPVRVATPAAIGFFLAHLGLQTAEGIGIVVSDIATAVTLGACPEDKRTPIVAYTDACKNEGICTISDAYTCDDLGGVMTSPTAWVGILGLMIMLILMAYQNRSAFIIGIGFITFISWFRGTAITYFPDTPAGNERFEYFKKVVSIEPLDKLLANYTSDLGSVGVALFTFLYVDFLDTSGTLLALVQDLGYTDEAGDFPRSRWAFASDAFATMFGSIFGLSPVTSYIESGAGVKAGARTGMAACICGFFFFLSIFFAPIIAAIPPWATGGALIIVGAIMSKSLANVKWYNLSHATSAFLTVIIMPLTYSIANGLIAGIGSFLIMEGTFFLLKFLGIPKPQFYPFGEEPSNDAQDEADDDNKDPDPTLKIPTGGDAESEEINDSAEIQKDESLRMEVSA